MNDQPEECTGTVTTGYGTSGTFRATCNECRYVCAHWAAEDTFEHYPITFGSIIARSFAY